MKIVVSERRGFNSGHDRRARVYGVINDTNARRKCSAKEHLMNDFRVNPKATRSTWGDSAPTRAEFDALEFLFLSYYLPRYLLARFIL